MISRQNVLELIGKDTRRYKHCILTTYSLDFNFFEREVMRALRLSDIRNINVLVDDQVLRQALEDPFSAVYQNQQSYSLIPIKARGAFHPKILFLAGNNHGMLIIGSGNLTSSGIGTNDEVWAAFHLDNPNSINAPIFGAAWQYLKSFFSQAKGYNIEKLSWVERFSPWLKQLSITTSTWLELEQQSLSFLANEKGNNIYLQLTKLIGSDNQIKKLTIVSPFYDAGGKVLKQLQSDFKIDHIECLVDTTFGTLPVKLENNQRIHFYEWSDCTNEQTEIYGRLHAKLMQFETSAGEQYLLVGSANATPQALGGLQTQAANDEACILLKRKRGSTYLQDLGITTKSAKPLNLKDYENIIQLNKAEVEPMGFPYSIEYAELDGVELEVKLSKAPSQDLQVGVFWSRDSDPEIYPLQEIVPLESESLHRVPSMVALYKNKVRVSAFCPITNKTALAKTNPDPKQQQLNAVCESLLEDSDRELFSELLKLNDYNLLDQSSKLISSRKAGAEVEKPHEKEYEAITPDAFESLPVTNKNINNRLLHTTTSQITQTLSLISEGLHHSDEVEESTEQRLLEESEGKGNDGLKVERNYSQNPESEIAAIEAHIEKLQKWFVGKFEGMVQSKLIKDGPTQPISLVELQNISISVDLMLIVFRKKYYIRKLTVSIKKLALEEGVLSSLERIYSLEYISTNEDTLEVNYKVDVRNLDGLKEKLKGNLLLPDELSPEEEERLYLYDGAYQKSQQSELKMYLIELLGSFLIASNEKANFKSYDISAIDAEIKRLRKNICLKALTLINALHWSETEYIYAKLLQLDLMVKLWPKPLQNFTKDHFASYAQKLLKSKSVAQDLLAGNWRRFEESLIQLIKWDEVRKGENKKEILLIARKATGQVIYKSPLGFAHVERVKQDEIHLKRPGFHWDKGTHSAMMSFVFNQERSVLVLKA